MPGMHCVYRKLAALSTGNHHRGSRTIKSSVGRVKIVYSIFFFTSSGCKDFVLLPSLTLLGEWSHLFSMSKIRCNFQLILFYTRRWTNRYSHMSKTKPFGNNLGCFFCRNTFKLVIYVLSWKNKNAASDKRNCKPFFVTPDSGAAASLGALPRLGDGASLPWKEALKEGQRRPFAPLEVGFREVCMEMGQFAFDGGLGRGDGCLHF